MTIAPAERRLLRRAPCLFVGREERQIKPLVERGWLKLQAGTKSMYALTSAGQTALDAPREEQNHTQDDGDDS